MLTTLLVGFLGMPVTAHAQTWWDTAWDYRQELPLALAGSDLSDFPLLVTFDSTRINTTPFLANGDDLRFVLQEDGVGDTELAYEIEHFDKGGTSVIWVRIPTLYNTAGEWTGLHLMMYWGNSGASKGENPTGVWRTDYKAVWHFDTSLEDSTTSNADLTASGDAAETATKIGTAATLDGTGDYYTSASDLSQWLDDVTGVMEAWIKVHSAGSATLSSAPGIAGYHDGSGGAIDQHWGWLDDSYNLGVLSGTDTNKDATQTLTQDTWHHVVLTRETNGKVKAYLDGDISAESTADGAGNGGTGTGDYAIIGAILNDGPGMNELDADLDEIRVWSGSLQAEDWIAANYDSQTDALITWCNPASPPTWYADGDGDGYGGTDTTVDSCEQPQGYSAVATDCNDGDPAINPGTDWYVDADNDDHGDPADTSPITQCVEPGGGDYAPNNDDCADDDPNNWTADGCANCADADSDGRYTACDAYVEFDFDCDDGNDRTWDTCGTCEDVDTDGFWTGCNQYPSSEEDMCDGSSANVVDFNNQTASGCANCADHDGDLAWSACDRYDNITEDHCDVDGDPTDENAWTLVGCAACDDNDSDTRYSGCDAYTTVTRDYCDDPLQTIDPYNWTDAACNGGCVDVDSDLHWTGCDSYDATDLPQDFCDQDDVVGQHHYSSACSNCTDADGDAFYVGCDVFDGSFEEDCAPALALVNPDTVWWPDGDNDGEPIESTAYNSGTPQCDDPSVGCNPDSPVGTCYAPEPNNALVSTDIYDWDCDDTDPDLNSQTTWFRDYDGDGYGGTTESKDCTMPTVPPGSVWVRDGGDCNDDDSDPDAEFINPETEWFIDFDDDGYVSQDPDEIVVQCLSPGAAYTACVIATCNDDCDDGDQAVHTPDADGISWIDEDAVGADDCSMDSDGDTVDDDVEWFADADDNDSDDDGDPDIIDPDDDGDLVPTKDEDYTDGGTGGPDGDPTNEDSDGDEIPDYLDPDDDGDCIWTIDEDRDGNLDPTDDDFDLDFRPNYRDPEDDGDLIPTAWEADLSEGDDCTGAGSDPYSKDSDLDSISDRIEWGDIGSSTPRDTDGDGDPDVIDEDDDADGLATFDESPDDLDGGDNCEVVGDGLPSYIDVDSDGDGYCDGTYVPIEGDDCVQWDGVIRDTTNNEEIPEYLNPFDYDDDGVPNVYDYDDLDFGSCDTDGDGLTNSEEHDAPCYNDGSVDHCLDPSRRDTNGDGVPDGLEVGNDPSDPMDTDQDGIPDWWDADDDGDHVDTIDEDYSDGDGGEADGDPTNDDTDDDGTPDYLDTDDDGDGILTIDEDWNDNGDPRDDDIDGDLIADYIDADHEDGPLGDEDGDGVSNADEDAAGTDRLDPDSDGDGILDGLEWEDGDGNRLDTDGDEIYDVDDLDDDGDGIPTSVEGAWDADGDGTPNYLDTDADDDTVDDRTEGGNAWEDGDPLPDSDNDGVPDFLDAVDDVFDTGGSVGPGPNGEQPGCACDTVPTPTGGLSGLLLLALVGLRRREGRRSA